MELKNILIHEYFTTADRQPYDYLFKYSESSKDVFKLGDLINRPFGAVKDFQFKMNQGITISDLIDFIVLLTGQTIKQVCNYKITDLIHCNGYVKNQIEFINSLEETNLISPYDPIADEADVSRFNKFGYIVQLDSLAGGDLTKYEGIRAMPYIDCFTKLLLEKERAEFMEQVNKIRTKRYGKV